MANRRTPDNVLKLKGTYRADRHAKGPEGYQPPTEGYPVAPAYLSGAALGVWSEVETVMGKCGLYTQADAAKLARYCCLESQFRDDPAEFPAARLTQLRLMERDLYLDPEARAKVGAVRQPASQGQPVCRVVLMTKDEIREARRAIEWKANLYALAAELLADAEAGDPLAMRIVTRVGLVEPLHIVEEKP